MKHNIRINGEIKSIDCDFGSGVFDKNNREIFDGDIIKIDYAKADKIIGEGFLVNGLRPPRGYEDGVLTVIYFEGRFLLEWRKGNGGYIAGKDVYLLTSIKSCVEVVDT